MRDFPIFATDYGVSSLVLKEIPYKKQAFICIRDVQEETFEEHLQECVSFCKMAGAEQVFASGHDSLQDYPLYTTVLQMCAAVEAVPEMLAQLFPVTEQTVSRWREIHNRAMETVDNASTLESRDEKRILVSGGAYFVHEEERLLGIGWLQDNALLAIASVVPGEGERVLRTILSIRNGERVSLEVASTNGRAIHLYEKLGFVPIQEISRWYRVD